MLRVGDRAGRSALRGLIAGALVTAAMIAQPASAATQSYVLTSFDSIRLNAPVKVQLSTGGGTAARGEGDRRTLDRIILENNGGQLTVRMKPLQAGESSGGPATLILSTGELKRVAVQGGGSLAIDKMKALRAAVTLGGGGDISIGAATFDRVDVSIGGSGKVTMAGTAGDLRLDLSGPGAFMGEAVKAKRATIASSGPGTATLMAQDAATITASGSGDVIVSGKPACTVNRGGTGRISCGGKEY